MMKSVFCSDWKRICESKQSR